VRYEIDAAPTVLMSSLLAPHGGVVESEGVIYLPRQVDPALVLRDLIVAGVSVRAFTPKHRSLEDLYMEIKKEHHTTRSA